MKISNQTWQEIIQQLQTNDPSLVDLNLNACELTDEEAIQLAQACKTNTVLQKLSLMNNQINLSGLKALAEMLEKNRSLLRLHLSGNLLTEESHSLFCSALDANPTLIFLSLMPRNYLPSANYGILNTINEKLAENKNYPIKTIIHDLKKNDRNFTTVNLLGYKESTRYKIFYQEYGQQFSDALFDNIYVKKLVADASIFQLLVDLSIYQYKYLQEIEISYFPDPDLDRDLYLNLRLLLDLNKNLIKIKFASPHFKLEEGRAKEIAEKVQRNYEAYLRCNHALINTLVAVSQGLANFPLSVVPKDILFLILIYTFSDNTVFRRIERQGQHFAFFTKVIESVSKKQGEKLSDNFDPMANYFAPG